MMSRKPVYNVAEYATEDENYAKLHLKHELYLTP